ncbi:MAG: NVEALA domain-containing protein [Bacteroidaceae bacterium]|nr:NVEALA domain-containing protein [Bacteroidaceae bacterium]
MSKKRIYAIVVAASLFTGYSAYHAQNKQELSDTLLANVEALATGDEDEKETQCPNPYDVRDHMLNFKQRKGDFSTNASGEISIFGKKFKIVGAEANMSINVTYEIGDCLTPAKGTCCPNSRNGEIKIIKTVFN